MKKILIMADSMTCGGVEKSLLSFLPLLSDCQVELLLTNNEGSLLSHVPPSVSIQGVCFKKGRYFEWNAGRRRSVMSALASLRLYSVLRILIYHGVYLRLFVPRWQWRIRQFVNSIDLKWAAELSKYDVAIAYGDTPEILAFIAHHVDAARKVAWLHNDFPRTVFDRCLWAPYYSEYHAAYACSAELAGKFKGFFDTLGLELQHIPYYLNPDSYRRLSQEYSPFEKSDCTFNLTSVGRVCNQKGFDLAIEAASRLVKEGFRLKWYIVGTGSDLETLQRRSRELKLDETVIFVGLKCNPYPYIANCDIYVQPSRYEGYCLTLAEARLLSRPIVTTDFVGAAEQIADGKTGLIVACSIDAITAGVRKLMTDTPYRQALSENLTRNQRKFDDLSFRQKVFGN